MLVPPVEIKIQILETAFDMVAVPHNNQEKIPLPRARGRQISIFGTVCGMMGKKNKSFSNLESNI